MVDNPIDKVLAALPADQRVVWEQMINSRLTMLRLVLPGLPVEYGDTVSEWDVRTPGVSPDVSGPVTWLLDLGQVWGDYAGYDVSRANHEYWVETHGQDAFVETEDRLGAVSLCLIAGVLPEDRDVDWLRMIAGDLYRLEDYPLLSEETHAELIDRLADEAWDAWLRSDVMSDLRRLVGDDRVDDLTDDEETAIRNWYYNFPDAEWRADSATCAVNDAHSAAVSYVALNLFKVHIRA